MTDTNPRVKVLYIASAMRSGSTMLGTLLGETNDAVHVGELDLIWDRWFEDRILCGCGQPFTQCEFWRDVAQDAFGGLQPSYVDQIRTARSEIFRPSNYVWLLKQSPSKATNQAWTDYSDAMSRLYQAIAKVSRAKVIIDIGKTPQHACFLDTIPAVELKCVHLVRDSRAVAFSFRRHKVSPAHLDPKTMDQLPWLVSARQWCTTNLYAELCKPVQKGMRLRYEDLVANPEDAITQIFRLLDEPLPTLDYLKRQPIAIRCQHTVSGNPIRFDRSMTIQLDSEWTKSIPRSANAVVTVATFPLLAYYGYLRRT